MSGVLRRAERGGGGGFCVLVAPFALVRLQGLSPFSLHPPEEPCAAAARRISPAGAPAARPGPPCSKRRRRARRCLHLKSLSALHLRRRMTCSVVHGDSCWCEGLPGITPGLHLPPLSIPLSQPHGATTSPAAAAEHLGAAAPARLFRGTVPAVRAFFSFASRELVMIPDCTAAGRGNGDARRLGRRHGRPLAWRERALHVPWQTGRQARCGKWVAGNSIIPLDRMKSSSVQGRASMLQATSLGT